MKLIVLQGILGVLAQCTSVLGSIQYEIIRGDEVEAVSAEDGRKLEATYQIWGQLIEKDKAMERGAIMSCFFGIGMKTCTYEPDLVAQENTFDLSGMDSDMVAAPFNWQTMFPGNKLYCLECCSNTRLQHNVDETLKIKCSLEDPRANYNGRSKTFDIIRAADWEFRFARRQTSTDDTVITCEIIRSDRTKYMVGYEVTLWIEEYNSVISFWRGVSKCEAKAIESNDADIIGAKLFEERIRLVVGSGWRGTASLPLLVVLYYMIY
mmetsp:Transcript_11915/g.19402  ORF Transcript_11915/g.19402 Transcript_11915/m.19402 type:complete len:265 (-) Transcript_11915:787-1581(-)